MCQMFLFVCLFVCFICFAFSYCIFFSFFLFGGVMCLLRIFFWGRAEWEGRRGAGRVLYFFVAMLGEGRTCVYIRAFKKKGRDTKYLQTLLMGLFFLKNIFFFRWVFYIKIYTYLYTFFFGVQAQFACMVGLSCVGRKEGVVGEGGVKRGTSTQFERSGR